MQKHFDKTQCRQKGISSSVGILIIIIIAIIAFGGVFAYQYFTPKTQPVVQTQQNQNTVNKTPIIEGISIEKPNLVVKGQNLSKVQIYFVPTGTGIDPETMSRIENAVKQSETNGNQVWTYRYPSDLLITNIFAKGFDDKGNLVKEVDLPIVGASALADALYGNTTTQTAGWKTYTNTQYGFSFQYPPSFGDLTILKDNSLAIGQNGNGTVIVFMPGYFHDITNKPATYSNIISEHSGAGYTKTNVVVGGIQSVGVFSPQQGYTIYVPFNNQFLTILGDQNDPLFNQMLNTFKFTK